MTAPAQKILPCPRPFSDHSVITIAGVDLPIRIFPGKALEGGSKKKAWLFWIHGGGWVGGKHYIPNNWVYPAFNPLGIHIISVSYRFIPQVSLPKIYQDVHQSFQWCLSNLASILGEDTVDINRYIIGGDSAGGHLSSYCSLHFDPKPTVNLDIFGAVDLTDPHLSTPVPERPILFNTPIAELERMTEDHNPSKATVTCAWTWELDPSMSPKTIRSFWGIDYNPGEGDKKRMDLNSYYAKTGTRIQALFQYTKDYQKLARDWSPPYHLDKNYPPTVFMHGKKDDTVPIEQSMEFADKLEGLGVDVVRIWSDEGKHSFEQSLGGPEDEGWQEYIVPCLDFVKKHIGE
ncbi:hypothetical protein I302_107512 [Kwoniella bestiolae CBS 10118]|uniref:Alpha/beta hydrolase fold-3 domain-containing protein n=1 Tax=Kwoniella bestiolae CBS 10118 TaxID=1296100 RepID=A0A1B9FYB0_9TREE|nr:hypothetical protein I302_06747 [Kwoniella bestiolae CBS 10118]OCF23763.1 hypothetical protein I302_06747 [Kwoniella bestiolae CBS 10118]